MTLVVTINGPETLWVCADQRLSAPGCAPYDHAQKIVSLETSDGVAILAYAGLGATVFGTQPSTWMSNTLRGNCLPLEQMLGILADAARDQLPHHLAKFPKPALPVHSILIPAFVNGHARLYSIDIVVNADRKSFSFQYTRHVQPNRDVPPSVAIAGSGEKLLPHRDWARDLLRLAHAHDEKKISADVVADHLAALNYDVSERIPDKSVGPNCFVKWQYRKGVSKMGGGGQSHYLGKKRDSNCPALPTIVNGMDVKAIIGILMPEMTNQMKLMHGKMEQLEIDVDALNSELAKLPSHSDKELR